jgi:prephenate dehydrogenase
MLDIFATNQINIIESLDLFKAQIDQIRELLHNNDLDSLKIIFERSVLHREQIIPEDSRTEPP